MEKFALIRLRSALSASDKSLKEEEAIFLKQISPNKEIVFTRPSPNVPTLFFVQTGGSEIYFKDCYKNYEPPYLLLVTGGRNSLAASLEILSFLSQNGLKGRILQGNPDYLRKELLKEALFYKAKKKLALSSFARIGKPSDWLIASSVDKRALKRKLGPNLIDIDMSDFFKEMDKHKIDEKLLKTFSSKTRKKDDLRESLYILEALRSLCKKNKLDGFTLRCFDIVKRKQETSCLAFGVLNEEGIIAGCEGDVPSMLSMYLAKLLTGQSSFMANPAYIDVDKKEAIYAHCTCPFDMLSSYSLPTHFESSSGLAIKGELKKEEITAIKLSPSLDKIRVLKGKITNTLNRADLCRTQIKISFEDDISSLLSDPYGNHMIFCYGDHKDLFEGFFAYMQAK